MSKLKHYKGEGWEVKVKYDEEMGILWAGQNGKIPSSRNLTINSLIHEINIKHTGVTDNYTENAYEGFINHLDTLTAPKILNERTFDNPNFKIRIWETEDKIGAETLWIREGFEYNRSDAMLVEIRISRGESTFIWSDGSDEVEFGSDPRVNTDEKGKSELDYTYSDLYKALKRAEQETCELINRDKFLKEFDLLLDKYYGKSNQTKEG